MTFVAVLLLLVAIAGFVPVHPRRIPANAMMFYWIPSWVGQTLALPLSLLTAVLVVASDNFGARFVFGLATILLVANHMRNQKDGQRLLAAVGARYGMSPWDGLRVFTTRAGTRRVSDLAYGDGGARNCLDLVMPSVKPEAPMPVLLHVHGGGWVVGRKDQQAIPLIHHMARKGWLVADMNYRLGPRNRFPAMVTDVLRAIAWLKAHVADYGGDPGTVFITGGSAGGHLAALAALAGGNAAFKPGFEDADCSVLGAVPMYGCYDFLDRDRHRGRNRRAMLNFEARYVMGCTADDDPEAWAMASPIDQVHADAPPMLVMHGRHDTLLPWEGARAFVDALKAAGVKVTYVQLSGGQHAFDLMSSALTRCHVHSVEHWLTTVCNKRRQAE